MDWKNRPSSSIDPIVCVCGEDMKLQQFDAWDSRAQMVVHVSGIWSCTKSGCEGNLKEQHKKRLEEKLGKVLEEIGKR